MLLIQQIPETAPSFAARMSLEDCPWFNFDSPKINTEILNIIIILLLIIETFSNILIQNYSFTHICSHILIKFLLSSFFPVAIFASVSFIAELTIDDIFV